MKIAMVIPSYLPQPEGGAERQCRLQARDLVRRGHEVTVYTRRWHRKLPRMEKRDGVCVVRLGWFYPVEGWAWTLRQRLTGRGKGEFIGGVTTDQVRMKQAVPPRRRFRVMAVLAWVSKVFHVLAWRWHFRRKDTRPDLLHVHADTWEGALCAVSGSRWGVPVFIKPTLFPLRMDARAVPFAGRGQRSAFQHVRYLALSAEIHETLSAKGIEANRIVDLPNGVEMPVPAAGLGRRQPMVLMVGNLTQGAYHKGFDVMLTAWKRIATCQPQAKLKIAGAGNAAPWLALARQFDCEGSVVFLGKVDDLGPYYAEAQVFCLPSREEGLSNALLEAQSHGVACVVSDIRANLAVVLDGRNGLVVPVGDSEALAAAVIRLLGDIPLQAMLGQQALQRVEQEFTLGSVVSRLEQAYLIAVRNAR